MAEHKTRKLSLSHIVLAFAVVITLFQLYTGVFGVLEVRLQRGIHLYSLLALFFFTDSLKEGKGNWRYLDWLGGILSLATLVYTMVENERISSRLRFVDPVMIQDVIFAVITVVILMEATRRVIGLPLVILPMVFLAYTLFGHLIPGSLGHVQVTALDIIDGVFLERIGIFGTTLGVSATYAFHFILFGAFFVKSGVGDFFIDLAMALAGWARGGAAKVAVISSALFGTVSGNAVSNVYTTGQFTIPMMKKMGFAPAFAGAVEAVASTGGMIMPPIMGAAAFVMAELIGQSYGAVALAAAIPAILYYASLMFMIHFRAIKTGMVGVPAEECPKVGKVFREGWMKLIPLIVLVVVMSMGYSAIMAVNVSILAVLLVSVLKKSTRFSPRDLVNVLAEGANSAVLIAVATAAAGIIVGTLTLTGSGLKFVNAITSLAGGVTFVIPIMVMVACIILGMGLPVTPAYIIVASLMTPAFADLNIPVMAAHMFMLYFATISAITPPVAIAAYAAGTLAKAPLMAVGVQASKLGLAGFIVPFMFIYNPSLVGIGTPFEVATSCLSAVIGCLALASAVEGWFFAKSFWFERIAMFAAALLLIQPGFLTDAIGLGLMVAVVLYQRVRKKAKINETAEAP